MMKSKHCCYIVLLTVWLLGTLCGAAMAEGYPESEHPYASNSDISWTYSHSEEAYALKVTFSEETEVESSWDFLYITDSAGVTEKYTGTMLQGETLCLPGNSFTIRLTSDGSQNKYGFSFSEIVGLSQAEYEEYLSKPRFTINSSGAITAFRGQVAELVIPDEIDGVKVTSIGSSAFQANTYLKTVTLPEGLTSIGSSAFRGCSSLTGLVLPDSLTAIGSYAFRDCSSLAGLVLPDGLAAIGSYAFRDCSSLTGDLVIPDGVTEIGGYAFFGCEGLAGTLHLPRDLVEIGAYAFEGCSLSGNLEFPEGLVRIGDHAFSGTHFTGDLIIPDSVTEIGERAFWSCYFDGTLTLPAHITQIKEGVFSWCTSLNGKLIIPESVTSIGSDAFAECWNLSGELNLPDGLTDLGESAFWRCRNLVGNVVIPEGITEIPSHCFYECHQLEGVQLSEAILSIGACAFEECAKLSSVRIYPATEEIAEDAFDGAPNVVLYVNSGSAAESLALENEWKYVLVDGCTIQPSDQTALYIGWPESFSVRNSSNAHVADVSWSSSSPQIASVSGDGMVTGLAEGSVIITATLPDGTSLNREYAVKTGTDESCFEYRISNGEAIITDYSGKDRLLVIPPSLGGYPVVRLDDHAFRFANCQRVYIPSCVKTIGSTYYAAFNRCFSLQEFRVGQGSIFYTIDGVLFGGEKYINGYGQTNAIMVQYPYGRIETSYTVPDGTVSLFGEVFEASHLKTIVLPDSLVEMNYNAFSLSDIESMYLPASVRYIQGGALSSMLQVEAIEAAPDNPYFAVEDGVLYSKDMKTLVSYPSGKDEDRYVIPDGVVTVGYGACENTLFREVSFPETLKRIAWSGFNSSQIRELYLPQSLETIDGWAFAYTHNLRTVVIPSSVKTINGVSFMSCGPLGGDEHTCFYFQHGADDSIAIEDEYTIPEDAVIYALPGGNVQAFAEQTGVNFASLAEVEAVFPQMMYMDESVAPVLTASGHEITLPTAWEAADGEIFVFESGNMNAVSNGFTEVWGTNDLLGLKAGALVVVRGGKEIILPEGLTTVEAEAFAGSAAQEVVCGDHVQLIGSRAFADCPQLYMIQLDGAVPETAEDAFEGSETIVVVTSSAEIKAWAEEQGLFCILCE